MPQSLKQASLYDQHSVSPHVPLSLDSLSLDSDISPQYSSQDSSRDGSPLHAASDRARSEPARWYSYSLVAIYGYVAS